MTSQLAIIGSTASGHCTGHDHGGENWTGVIDTTTGTIGTAGGIALCPVGSSGLASCGHRFVIIDGSTITTINGVGLGVVGSDAPTTPMGSSGTILTGYLYGTTN